MAPTAQRNISFTKWKFSKRHTTKRTLNIFSHIYVKDTHISLKDRNRLGLGCWQFARLIYGSFFYCQLHCSTYPCTRILIVCVWQQKPFKSLLTSLNAQVAFRKSRSYICVHKGHLYCSWAFLCVISSGIWLKVKSKLKSISAKVFFVFIIFCFSFFL